MPGQFKKFSIYFYNIISYFGAYLALLVVIAECFLFSIDFIEHGKNLYIGLFTYLLLPPLLILGLLLIPIGALWKRYRVNAGKVSVLPKVFVLDPQNPQHRNLLTVFLIGTTIFVVMTFAGLYRAFHYTESVEFCGVLCHKIMSPEHTTYLQSPHSKVKCVDCHIGSGADWYLHSKLSGARQVAKAISHTYKAPIETLVKDLRPASETCLQCHSPGKSFGSMDMKRIYYPSEAGQPWKIRMLMNVGGGGHQSRGVHAHMNIENDIYYAAEDEKRQKITWIKSIDASGKETIFTTPNSKWAKQAPNPSQIRKMDCIDCHNRPTHQYRAPYKLVNEAMQFNELNPEIPEIKKKALDVLSAEYSTTAEAMATIEKKLTDYYQQKHPEYLASHQKEFKEALSKIQTLYTHNMFPEMKVRWDTHADNIGHFTSDGCFRCHDGQHKSVEEKTISKDCRVCHVIVEQGPLGNTEKNLDGLEFKHPVDIGDDWKEASCTDCHTGGA